jgi:carbon starvation protein CstA
VIVPLQDYPEDDKEIRVNVKKNKKTTKKWIILAIVLIVMIVIAILVVIIVKVLPHRSSPSRFYTFDYLLLPSIPFSYFCEKSFIYYR